MDSLLLERLKSNLQVIILESPYETLKTPEGRLLFANLMDLKIKGYLQVHEKGAMPFDTTDFFATHIVVCRKNDPLNNILMSYKSTSYFDCQYYNVPFPFINLLKVGAHPNCLSEMEKVLKRCDESREDLSYDTGWTINPEVRENKALQFALKEMVTMFVINHHRDYGIPHWVTLGILKVKTDQFFLQMGLSEISNEPIVHHPFLHQTDGRAVLSFAHQYSQYTFETAKKYQSLWNERQTISTREKKKAAA